MFMRSPASSKPVLVAVAVLLVLGIGLRSARVFSWPVSGDEIYTIWNAESALSPTGELSPARQFQEEWAWRTMPLLQLASCATGSLFGVDEFSARLVPWLSGLLTLLLLPFLVWRWWSGRLAIVFLTLLALSPRAIQVAQWARYESLCFLFGGIALVCLLRMGRGGAGRGHATLALCCAASAVASHLTALLPCILATVALAWRGRLRGRTIGIAIAVLIGLIAVSTEVVRRVSSDFLHDGELLTQWRWVASAVYDHGPGISVLAAIGAWRWRHRDDLRLLLWTVSATAVVFLCASPFLRVGIRYLAGVEIAVPLLAALAVVGPGDARRNTPLRGRAVAVLGVAVLIGAPLLIGNALDGQRYDFRAMAEELRLRAHPGDRVLADHHGLVEWELRSQSLSGVELRELPESAAELRRLLQEPHGGRDWLILLRQRSRLVHGRDESERNALLEQWTRPVRVIGRTRPDRALLDFALVLLCAERDGTTQSH